MTRTGLSLFACLVLPSAAYAQVGEPGNVDYTPELPPTATWPVFTDIAPSISTFGADFDDIGSGRGQLIADLVGPDPSDPTNPLKVGPPDGIPDIFQSNSNSPVLPLGATGGGIDVPAVSSDVRPCILLRGEPGGGYTNVAPISSPLDPSGYNVEYPGGSPWGVVGLDYDSDGFLDMFHANGGFNVNSRNTLNRNNGDGTFQNVSLAAGISEKQITFAAVALDYDLDGDLDIYVGNSIRLNSFYVGDPDPSAVSRLHENQGDGTFVDVAAAKECDLQATVFSLASGDLDRNGYPDIYASCYKQLNKVFYGQASGVFSFMAPATNPAKAMSLDDLVPSVDYPLTEDFASLPPGALDEYPLEPTRSMPLEIVDINGDRWLDLVVVSWTLQQPDLNPDSAEGGFFAPVDRNRVYLNRGDQDGDGAGDGMYREASNELGLDHLGGCMCIAVGDYNGDNYPDVYLGGGGPNLLYHNEEDYLYISEPTAWPDDFQQDPDQPLSKAFWELGALVGTYDNLYMSHGANVYLRDGKLDLVIGNGGPAVDDEGQRNVYWQNTGNADGLPYTMTDVRLTPDKSAPGAPAALVEVVRDSVAGGAHQTMSRSVAAGSRFGCQNALGASFGLGQGGLLWGGVRWPSGVREGQLLWALNQFPTQLDFTEPDFSLGLDAEYPAGGGVDLVVSMEEFGAQPRIVALTFAQLRPVGSAFVPGPVIPINPPVVVNPGVPIQLNGLISTPSTGLFVLAAVDLVTGELINVGAVWHEPALESTVAPMMAGPGAPFEAGNAVELTQAREAVVFRASSVRVSESGMAKDARPLALDGRGARAFATGDVLRWSEDRVELDLAALAFVQRGPDGSLRIMTGQVDTCCEDAPIGGALYVEIASGELLAVE